MDLSFNLNLSADSKAKELDEKELYDVVIIGGGPAAMTAAVYCMRKGVKTALVTKNIGGQVSDTKSIENYMGYNYIEGEELVKKFEEQVKQFEIAFKDGILVTGLKIENDIKIISLDNGQSIKTKSVIVSAGNRWRELNVPGEKEFRGRGVSYCSTCDGPFFKNLNVVVVGGGNSGVEAALDLIKIAKHVTIVEFTDSLKADKILIDKLKEHENHKILLSSAIKEIKGDEYVTSVMIEDQNTKETYEYKTDGVFVEIGLIPNSNFLKDIIKLNNFNEIIIDEKCETNVPGVFAAGDITSVPFKQIIIASGEGAKAAMAACEYVMKK
ncbi:alkyl hydroperoxide reductase subunit F [Hypnocyclicus thermotrophus]|uniref:Alkyl hydroperoxide reductase subunit F n=1 Tax=Hypnocyclicus thermotrophus TaxID=1627895 RepID=A0AA46I751_9FUSO|nr:FAD-dependent oxidoreductase [Hypnocyclicus thermotrophus]TDT72353.1 alkyl hydroperoxide reductase subunit F [Hypnocyclicus thermotrophus]